MSRPTPRRIVAALSAALVVAPLAVTVALVSAPAQAGATTRCASVSSKYIGGTLYGQDGRDINAQVSLNVVDKYGKGINMLGCRTSLYTKTIWMNKRLSGDGAPHTAATTRTWRLSQLPANAAKVWIEVWTRTNAGSRWLDPRLVAAHPGRLQAAAGLGPGRPQARVLQDRRARQRAGLRGVRELQGRDAQALPHLRRVM